MEYKLDHFITYNPLIVEISTKKGISYWLQDAILWVDEDNVQHYVPKGIVSDGYSIPKWMWGMLRGLKSRVPSYLHDWQFWTHEAGSLALTNFNIRHGIILTESGLYNTCKVGLGLWLGGWIAWRRYGRVLNEYGYDYVTQAHIADTLCEAKVIASQEYI